MKFKIYLDLFSGIGGFAKGFDMAGFTFDKHYFSEIDKNAIANYKYNFKNAKYAGDIRTISTGKITDRPNLITFGFPCQDLSVAGKGKGLSGARSGLFYEAVRLIKEFKPDIFIFENVKGLLSSNKGKDFELVLRTIADIGLYECEWQLLNTAWLLPQNRERVYFVGHLAGRSKPRVFPFSENDFRINERTGKTTNSRTFMCGTNGGLNSHNTLIKTITAGGHSGGMHSSMSLIVQKGRGFNKGGNHEVCPTLSSNSFEQNNFVKRQLLKFLNRNQKNYEGDYAYTIDSANTGGVNINGEIRRLTEIECERLQGFPDNWTMSFAFLKFSYLNLACLSMRDFIFSSVVIGIIY